MESSRSDPRVVTPTDRTPPQWLRQCAASVPAQTCPRMHIVAADGTPADGFEASRFVPGLPPGNCGDFGDGPRTVEAFYAAGPGVCGVAPLGNGTTIAGAARLASIPVWLQRIPRAKPDRLVDAGHCFDPDHIASLVARTGTAAGRS